MIQHRLNFQVREVLLTKTGATLHLDPGRWMVDHPTATIELDGEQVPDMTESEVPGQGDWWPEGQPSTIYLDHPGHVPAPGQFLSVVITTVEAEQ